MRWIRFLLPLLILGLLAACAPKTTPQGAMPKKETEAMMAQPEHILMMESEMTWADAPAVLPAGAKVAVLEGDPSKAGSFTLRLKFPANYTIAPHTHPADEHVTVISGSFSLGMGGTFDETKLKDIGKGGFAMMRTGTQHFAWTKDGATIQLHGVGPWGLTYVNSADDPRTMTK